MPLNRTRILASAPAKTSEQYAAIRAAQQSARLQRSGKWPEFSEYTDAYLLNGIDKTTLPPIERYSIEKIPSCSTPIVRIIKH